MVRSKARYLVCEVCFSDRSKFRALEQKAVYVAVRAAVAKAHGEYGAAIFSISFTVKYLNAYTGVVILRLGKAHYRLLWSSLPFINDIRSQNQKVQCFFNCIHIGGTIRTCQKFLVRYGRRQLCRMLPHCTTEAEKQEVRRAVLSCSSKKFGKLREEESEDGEESEEEQT